MKWRTTLTHEIEGSVVISEPDGLVSALMGFTRHPDFHTLVKEFKSAIRLYGNNGTQNGGRDWVKNIEYTYGPDSVIGLLHEYAPDNFTFATLYNGEIGVQTVIEAFDFDHTIEFTPVQKGFWRKFISRYDTQVDIQSPLNLDGEPVTVYDPEVLNMSGQAIHEQSKSKQDQATQLVGIDYPDDFTSPDFQTELATNQIAQVGLDNNYLNEIKDFFNIPSGVLGSGIQANKMFVFEFGGVYQFDIKYAITALFINYPSLAYASGYHNLSGDSGDPGPPTDPAFKGEMYIQFNEEAPILLTATHKSYDFAVHDPDAVDPDWTQTNGWSEFTYIATKAINRGDYVRVWFKNTGDPFGYGNNTVTIVDYQPFILGDNNTFSMQPALEALYPGISLFTDISFVSPYHALLKAFGNPDGAESHFNIIADTLFEDTQAQGFLTHDVGAYILDRITDQHKFYSLMLGSQYTKARTYDSAGAWWNNINLKAIHARGYTLSEKRYSSSFKDYWEGINPLLNLSLGYENIEGVDRIVIRTKAEAYDSSSMSVLLSGVQKIKRRYSPDYFNSAETGFSNGKTEDISGIDDPQKETRASILKNIGRGIKILTTWICQGLTIEQARRATRVKSADYKFDDNTLLVEVSQDVSGQYKPRLDEDFTSVTNLSNEATRYNKHHTPARFFLRWLDYLSGGLQHYLGTVFKFTGGEGNYDMVSTMVSGSVPDDYVGVALAENANIPVGTVYLWVPQVFEIEHYLTIEEFNTIDANRNTAIGISQTYEDGSHAEFFIDDLQMEIMTSQVKIVGKFKNLFMIKNVQTGGQIFQGGRIFDATFEYVFE